MCAICTRVQICTGCKFAPPNLHHLAKGLVPVYPVITVPAVLKSAQDKLIKQSQRKIMIFSFSQQEILVAKATKEKSYTDATITLALRLVVKLVLLIKDN